MNVASCGRSYFIIIGMLCLPGILHSMIFDSRYFPWIDHMYNGSDHRHGHLIVDGFLIIGGDAYRMEAKALKEEQIVSIPGLWGDLKLAEVGNSLTLAGKSNPIPADWRWLSDMNANMSSSLDGQGVMIGGFVPVSTHFGIGASTLVMNLNSAVRVFPGSETVEKLYLKTPGNSALFTQMMRSFYQELNISSTVSQETGAGDTVVYATAYGVKEYEYKMRKIDGSVMVGVIVPTGVKYNPYNLGSVPFGGNGLWGLFIAPTVEIELKEELKVGLQARVTQRLAHSIKSRIPINNEQPLFSPFVGSVYDQPGVTFTGTGYLALEEIRAGFGVQLQYTVTYHAQDHFSTRCLKKSSLKPDFSKMACRSSFVSEYLTLRIFYDIAHDRDWKNRPLITACWDIPRNYIGGKSFAKTNRVSLGCTVNF